MPRSSRSKSHKQNKHSSKEARDYSDYSEEDMKVKERNGKDEVSVRVSKDLMTSGEKRKSSSGKDLYVYGNGDVTDEPVVVSKRRKEKVEGFGGSDRRNADGERSEGLVVDKDKDSKTKESKVPVDLRSKSSSRRHDSDKRDVTLNVVMEKEESKSGNRVDSKPKSEKEYGRKEYRDVKEKDHGDKEKIFKDTKDGEFARKHGSHSGDVNEEHPGKRGRDNTDCPVQDELRNPELEKELEKRIRRRGDGSGDKDIYQDDARDYDDKRSSKGERSKDVRYKDEKYRDKYNEDSVKYSRHKEDRENVKDSRYREAKYREDGEKDDKYRDTKHHEYSERDTTNCDGKFREDGDRDKRHKNDKYLEDGERNTRRREDKYHEDGDKDDRHRNDKCWEDLNKDNRHKEDKPRENVDRDIKHKDMKQINDSDRDKKSRDAKYRDEHSSRDRISESEIKRLRDENDAADHRYSKSNDCDISPTYDDRGSRYKDDNGNRKDTDKEEHNDVRSQKTKERRFDAEMRSGSGKVDLVTDRGKSNIRNAEVDVTLNYSRRRSSPSSSSHGARDHYRVSKREDSKFRDYGYEDRKRHNVSSVREFNGAKQNEKVLSSRSVEKSVQKDDSLFHELSADRRPKSDVRASPLQMLDKSPSSTSNDRRHLSRSDVRRTFNVEESGQRNGGSRDYSKREGNGNWKFPMETNSIDEFSQPDGDNASATHFTRNFFGNSRSILPPPPPPFRTGVDSPLVFGSSEDDNRGRFNNRHRRIGDSNMGRPQGNAWKGPANWSSPVTNGYIPFQHGPPPVGFHAVMQQFPTPPIFGVRPTMDLNHNLPYHMSDADRFPGHVHQLGWRNSVDDSCAPPLYGWDGNSSVFSDGTGVYGRLDWDQNRTQMGSRGWDTSSDAWKEPNSGFNTDLTSAPQIENLLDPVADEILAGQQAMIELNQPNVQADNLGVQSVNALRNVTLYATENTPFENCENSKMSVKDDVHDHRVYLSNLDISIDLAEPVLYEQFTSFMDLDHNTVADEDDFKILYVEEAIEAKVADKILSAAASDYVFKKAMSLYEKQRGETRPVNGERVLSPNSENLKVVQASDNEKAASNEGNSGGLASCCDGQGTEDTVSDYKEHINFARGSEACQMTACKNLDEASPTDHLVGSEKVKTVKMEMEVDPVSRPEVLDIIMENNNSLQNVEHPYALLPSNLEELPPGSPAASHSAEYEHKLIETKCGTMHLSDESAEAMMPKSIESGSVNLSRIHHSPESTH